MMWQKREKERGRGQSGRGCGTARGGELGLGGGGLPCEGEWKGPCSARMGAKGGYGASSARVWEDAITVIVRVECYPCKCGWEGYQSCMSVKGKVHST